MQSEQRHRRRLQYRIMAEACVTTCVTTAAAAIPAAAATAAAIAISGSVLVYPPLDCGHQSPVDDEGRRMDYEWLAAREHPFHLAQLQPNAVELHLLIATTQQPKRRGAARRACPCRDIAGQVHTAAERWMLNEALSRQGGLVEVALCELGAADGNLPSACIRSRRLFRLFRLRSFHPRAHRRRLNHAQGLVEQQERTPGQRGAE